LNPFAVNLLDYSYAPPEDRHAVALFQGALLLASVVILFAPLDQVIEPNRAAP
jgi:hypothetical protein